jgi:5-methylcytosine-specific restriction endonuclease McrA
MTQVVFTEQHLQQMISERGGFSVAQIRMSKEITKETKGKGKGPSHLVGLELDQSMIDMLVKLKSSSQLAHSRKKKKKKKVKDFCPFRQRIQEIKNKHKIKNVKAEQFLSHVDKKIKDSKMSSKDFYKSQQWRLLRAKVLEKYECKCMMCGHSPKEHGIVIHVDHIKPRSTHPHLQLREDNLQLLCEDCNLGKSNFYSTDWRPSDTC